MSNFDTPVLSVSPEAHKHEYLKMEQLVNRLLQKSGDQILEPDALTVYGDSTLPIPVIAALCRCSVCGPESVTELRRLSDFYATARKDGALKAADLSGMEMVDIEPLLPREPLVVQTVLLESGIHVAMLTWQKPAADAKHKHYTAAADGTIDMLLEMLKFTLHIARLARTESCQEIKAQRTREAASRN